MTLFTKQLLKGQFLTKSTGAAAKKHDPKDRVFSLYFSFSQSSSNPSASNTATLSPLRAIKPRVSNSLNLRERVSGVVPR